jgi:hypothetical protein
MSRESPPLLGEDAFGYYQTFSKNISDFLSAHGSEVALPKGALQGIRCWFINLSDGAHLHVYAETVSEQNATCDQCRIIGTRASVFREVFDQLQPILGDHILIMSHLFFLCRLGYSSSEQRSLPFHHPCRGKYLIPTHYFLADLSLL